MPMLLFGSYRHSPQGLFVCLSSRVVAAILIDAIPHCYTSLMLYFLISGCLLRAASHLSTDSMSAVVAKVVWTGRAAFSLLLGTPQREAAAGSTTRGNQAGPQTLTNCLAWICVTCGFEGDRNFEAQIPVCKVVFVSRGLVSPYIVSQHTMLAFSLVNITYACQPCRVL